jgi:hypothetical protein
MTSCEKFRRREKELKTFEDHLNNLLEKYESVNTDSVRLIYEMIKYELEGDSSFLKKLKSDVDDVLARNEKIEKIYMNFPTFSLFRNERNLTSFDPETKKEVLQTGKYGNIWGFDIYIDKNLKELEFKIISVKDEENSNGDFEKVLKKEVLKHL